MGSKDGRPSGAAARDRRRTAVQVVVEVARDPVREPRELQERLDRLLAELLHRPELLEQPLAPGRAQPGHVVEHRTGHPLVAQLAVVRDREPVRLVPHLLQQVERLGVARDAHRIRAARHVDLLEPLGQADDADVLEAELLEHPHRDVELALAAVDHQQVRRVREPLPGPGAFVALVEVAPEAPA